MFKKPTVFITGAGASCHYGYPTGEALVREVIKKAHIFADLCRDIASHRTPEFLVLRPKIVNRHQPKSPVTNGLGTIHMQEQWMAASQECNKLASRLTLAHPPAIDYFLGWNEDLREIGKFLIAWVILECEAKYFVSGGPRKRADGDAHNWHRFIVYKLVSGYSDPKRILENKVTFITFNYDISLETSLALGLGAYSPIQPLLPEFQKMFDVLHIYGRVHDHSSDQLDLTTLEKLHGRRLRHVFETDPGYPTDFQRTLDEIYAASERIKTIGPHSKGDNETTIKRAQHALLDAQDIYICGDLSPANSSSFG